MKKDEYDKEIEYRFMKKDKSKAMKYKSIHEKRWIWHENRI